MYERTHGSKYASLNGYQPAAVIAKLMRADIKDAINQEALPGAMANYSVKVHNYSGGRSIEITAIDLDGMWETCDGLDCRWHDMETRGGRTHQRLSFEGKGVEAVLKTIHNAYNYDGSEVMVDYFDVNYYGSAKVEDEWRRECRLAEKARKAARKAARA